MIVSRQFHLGNEFVLKTAYVDSVSFWDWMYAQLALEDVAMPADHQGGLGRTLHIEHPNRGGLK